MADKQIKLRVFDIVGQPIWVATDDGQKVFDKITEALQAGCKVNLSFADRGPMVGAFFNAAIGQLYSGEYTDEFLQKHLAFSDLDEDSLHMLARTVTNAKRYFANPEACDRAWEEVVGADEDEE